MVGIVPIRVEIGLKPNGHHDFPDWHQLPLAQSDDPANHQIVKWLYDKTSDFEDDDAHSPLGLWIGVMCVTAQFASEAVTLFPTRVSVMTEADLADFYDNRAMARQSDELRDDRQLASLHTEFVLVRDLIAEFPANTKLKNRATALKSLLLKALDPDDDTPGVRTNPKRRWATIKAKRGYIVVTP